MDWATETMRATVVLLAASVVLVGAGTAGLGGSVVLAVLLLPAAAGLYAVRATLAELPTVLGHDLGSYGEVVWLAPVVAAGAVSLATGTTAAELQAVGGLVGLVGMANYFLRPVYHALVVAGRYAARVAG